MDSAALGVEVQAAAALPADGSDIKIFFCYNKQARRRRTQWHDATSHSGLVQIASGMKWRRRIAV